MSTLLEIKRVIDGMGEAFEAYKATNDDRLAAALAGNESLAAELNEKLSGIDKDVSALSAKKTALETELKNDRDRLEELEARSSVLRMDGGSKAADDYMKAFDGWIRAKGASPEFEAQMSELMRKEVTIGSPAGGGYAVPEVIAREIERLELLYSPVRRLVKVVKVGTSDYKELVNLRGAGAAWVGETAARGETATPTLREVTPTHGELYAYPKASEWSLDDTFFNIESWLSGEVAEAFAIAEGISVLNGDGTNKPTGMLNTTPVLTDDDADPARAAAAYEYVPSDTAADPVAPGIVPDALIDLVYLVNSAYRARGTWTMNSLTTGSVRKLKNGDGDYIWQPGLSAGNPDRLLGYPVETWEHMQDIAANAFPIAFGDFKRGYVLVDRMGLRITRDNVTQPGFIRFYTRRREGGHVLNNDAIKFIRTI
jgi:HK97 family phage major capsid protein